MTTDAEELLNSILKVVEAYRLDRYDNEQLLFREAVKVVVEAYRLDRYDNFYPLLTPC